MAVVLAGVLATAVGLAVADRLLSGLSLGGLVPLLVSAAAVSVVGAVLRPLLVVLATILGWPGALVLGLFGQSLVVFVAFAVVPGVDISSFWAAFGASWIVGFVATSVAWLATAGTDQAVTAHLVRRARRKPSPVADPGLTGVVFVQLDGVPFPVLEWGVLSGTLPTLARWVRSGSHRMAEWTPMLPATTPASQMGILHGTIDGIPAFRWVDRATGRVLVANRPKDASDIEASHSDGRGLLADGGVSVSNLFTGDAPTAFATMSALGAAGRRTDSRKTLNAFLARPEGFARGVSRTLSEVARERFQARRQVRQDVRPRVPRGWGFAVERAALNGVLRDFNTVTVAGAMLAGARSIYVDYVDYDAMAHHAGIMRPESLDALVGLDTVLRLLERVEAVAPRRYRIVVLSDHGQSQGEVFADRFGEELSALVARLADTDVAAAEVNTEGAAQLSALVGGDTEQVSVLDRALLAGSTKNLDEGRAQEDAAQATESDRGQGVSEGLLVFGSGNLGLVYVAGERHRLALGELTQRYPALVPGLVAHGGVSFVVVLDAVRGVIAIGKRGEHRLQDGVVRGEDPLEPFGPDAPAFVLRAASMPEAPDVLVNSMLDPGTGEVAAFEHLVGCHGGLGGWQDRAMLVWPADLPPPPARIVGADAMHRQLVAWLEHLGHRGSLGRLPASRTTEAPGEPAAPEGSHPDDVRPASAPTQRG